MGVYVYTLRKNTNKISGLEVAQYAYAYKDGWGADDVPANRRRIAAGYRAADAVNTPYYVICSDFDDVRENPTDIQRYFVYKTAHRLPGVSEGDLIKREDECVGYLVRSGRKIVIRN